MHEQSVHLLFLFLFFFFCFFVFCFASFLASNSRLTHCTETCSAVHVRGILLRRAWRLGEKERNKRPAGARRRQHGRMITFAVPIIPIASMNQGVF